MKILITGSTGFLGKQIHSFLIQDNIVLGLSRKNSYYNVDLSNIIPLFTDDFDLVIHCSGKAHSIPTTEKDSISFYSINVTGTTNLLKGLTRSNLPKYFLFISSVSVYGLTEGSLINEEYPLIANDPYGKSKIECELLIQDWCKKHNVICTILRLPLIIGPNPPGNLGDMIKSIKNGYYFNIGEGNARKSMVLASDVSKHIIQIATVGGVYNLTDGYHPTFKELSRNIANQLGKSFLPSLPLSVAKLISKIGDMFFKKFPINTKKLNKINSTLTFDDSKARTTCGWKPNHVLSEFNI